MSEPLIAALAQRLDCSPEEAEVALYQLIAHWQQQLQQTGQVVIPGLGGFYRTAQGLRFEPAGALAQAVNYRFAGLESVTIEPTEAQPYSKVEVIAPEVPEETETPESVQAPAPEAPASLPETPEPEPAAAETPLLSQVEPATHRLSATPPPRPPRIHLHEERARKLPLWIPAALVIVALGAIGIWWLLSMRPTSPASPTPTLSPETTTTAIPPETTSVATAPQADTAQPTSPPPSTPMRDGYALIVGSTTNRAEAEQMAERFRQRLAGQGLSVEIITAPANGTTRYRIAVGRYTSAEEALTAKQQLGSLVPADAWVLRLLTN